MSRGLGSLQRQIKSICRDYAKDEDAVSFSGIRSAILRKPKPSAVRSLKRALKTLVDRGEVLIVAGMGGPVDPYYYMTFEDLIAYELKHGERVRDKTHAREIAEHWRKDNVFKSLYPRPE
jgi:hypothetical protein